MRLFVAINFNDQSKATIASIQSKLMQYAKGSYTPPENIHLTLVFLGEISPKKIIFIKQAMNQIIVEQVKIQFSHTGFFKRNEGDIWWIGLQQNDKLIKLQKDLRIALIKQGFNIEERFFKPHITLGRRIRINMPIDKNELFGKPFKTEVNTISLMKSERINGKLTYTEIYTSP